MAIESAPRFVMEPILRPPWSPFVFIPVLSVQKSQPNRPLHARVSILESEKVNPLYQFIFPVKLDGGLTEFAFCQKCDTFLPKAVVTKMDYDHRCLQLQGGACGVLTYTQYGL